MVKNNIKMVICAIAIMGLTIFGTPINFVQNVSNLVIEADAGEARAYIYEWLYKVIDGHVYKRLFNCTTEEWVGDWILVE